MEKEHTEMLTEIFKKDWNAEKVPKDWENGVFGTNFQERVTMNWLQYWEKGTQLGEKLRLSLRIRKNEPNLYTHQESKLYCTKICILLSTFCSIIINHDNRERGTQHNVLL